MRLVRIEGESDAEFRRRQIEEFPTARERLRGIAAGETFENPVWPASREETQQ
jgi:hypothetical protein